ncbi:MAG: hypothetical protein IKX19_03515, partial [Clostridia bacterium]|nr:hypothetical protein [Clostridia bacterium]
MKPMRKALSLLLALLLLCPLFAACSEKTPDAAADPASPDPAADNEQTAAEAVPETEEDPLDPAVLYDGLPEDGYGGYEFLMLIRPNDRWIADMAADLKHKVIGLLDQVFPEYETCFTDIFGLTSSEVLRNCPTPADI